MKFPLFALLGFLLLLAMPQGAEARDSSYNRPYGNHNGNCRAYTRQVVQNGRWETAYGTACLYTDGIWRIVAENTARQSQYQPQYYVRQSRQLYSPDRYYYNYDRYDRYDRYTAYGRHGAQPYYYGRDYGRDFLYRGPVHRR